MARKQYSIEDCLKILHEIELHFASGVDEPTMRRSPEILDAKQ